jgi:hypothetical protein
VAPVEVAPAEPAAPAPPEPAAPAPDVANAAAAGTADLERRLAELEAKQAEAETAALLSAPSGDTEIEVEALKIYGFADFGAQRVWISERSFLRDFFETNSTSFVVGNLNFYFDAQPIEHWRSLVEVRFTNAPHGEVDNYGGLGGNFSRRTTEQFDPHASVINASMWGGSTVIERAWIEWNQLQGLKLRLGNFFTPFGIWNEDHGTPTLISMGMPQFLIQAWIPIRQTGVTAYGSTFAGEWELGYTATFTNGRQELSNFNFGDTFGYGGRLIARREGGFLNTTFGLSFYTGTDSDSQIDVLGVGPVDFDSHKNWEYTEYNVGVDAAVDIGATRLRAEWIWRRQVWDEDQREPASPLFAPGGYATDKWMQGGYIIVAHELPWGGVEPYLYAEVTQQPGVVADGNAGLSFGVNWHINSAITWKTQLSRSIFFDWLYDTAGDASADNVTIATTRLVMAF